MAWTYITAKPYPLYKNVIGDDWRKLVPVVYSDRSTEFDFSGWEAEAVVRYKHDGTEVIRFSSYDSTIVFEGGNMYLIADKDETAQLEPREAVWDCAFLDPTLGTWRTLILESPFELYKKV